MKRTKFGEGNENWRSIKEPSSVRDRMSASSVKYRRLKSAHRHALDIIQEHPVLFNIILR